MTTLGMILNLFPLNRMMHGLVLLALMFGVGCDQRKVAVVAMEDELVKLRIKSVERKVYPMGEGGATVVSDRSLKADGTELADTLDKKLKEVLSKVGGEASGRMKSFESGGLEVWRSAAGLPGGDYERIETKHISIEEKDGKVFTEVLVEAVKNGAQWNARLKCRWSQGLVLEELTVVSLVEVRCERSIFADATMAVIGGVPNFESQINKGVAYWADRITKAGDFYLTGHHGMAVGDVNGDGLEDLFVCDGGSLPNRLYLQNADGTARDASAEAGLDWLEDSRGALLVDLDNDGDEDLVVSTIAMLAFAENDGTGKFTLRGGHPGAQYAFSISAADYDLDGDLDVYACVYGAGDDLAGKRGFEAMSPVPFDDAENGGRNVLLANLGGFRFADVTQASGLDAVNSRWSLAAAWEDFDLDGDADLYVANDFGRNCLYRNDREKGFVEVAAKFGVENTGAGMSVSWGDWNRDGRPDLYVGNMFSSAGRRQFSGGENSLWKMARGNSLLSGSESGAFVDGSSDVEMGRWAWSSAFVDFNNDGWEDLLVSNGFLTQRRQGAPDL
jgi:hypothetical protein